MQTQLNYSDCTGNACKKLSAKGGVAVGILLCLSFAAGLYTYHRYIKPIQDTALAARVEAETMARMEAEKSNQQQPPSLPWV